MKKIVVADTSPLNLMEKLYGKILIPEVINYQFLICVICGPGSVFF